MGSQAGEGGRRAKVSRVEAEGSTMVEKRKQKQGRQDKKRARLQLWKLLPCAVRSAKKSEREKGAGGIVVLVATSRQTAHKNGGRGVCNSFSVTSELQTPLRAASHNSACVQRHVRAPQSSKKKVTTVPSTHLTLPTTPYVSHSVVAVISKNYTSIYTPH